MDNQWIGYNLETFSGGVSSAVFPDLLPNNQVAWGMNADFRGSKIHTRPNIAQRTFLPSGLVQGAGYFNLQGGMIIVMIAGVPYRIRVGIHNSDFSFEQIVLPWYNSAIIKQVWMVQTPETFIIQDGQSAAILYDGSTARRSNASIPEVPIGLMMAYGNGRLWVAVQGNELVAGDIRTADAGSELKFTETQYLSGGGTLSFDDAITGLGFIPTTGVTDYGALLVFGRNSLNTVRADITQRDAWASYPGFVTNAMRNVGTPSGWSLCQVNQDLFWRDSLGGMRSINTVLSNANNAQYRGAPVNSNVSISREVSRLVDFDSQQLLRFSSAIYFDNRLLVTSSPFMNRQGGVSWKDLISLDFSPVSMMQGQAPAAYNGSWQGVNWTKLINGEFNQKNRSFGISSDEDGVNRLWEFSTSDLEDSYIIGGISTSDGTSITNGSAVIGNSPIEAFIEYPRVDFNDPKKRKRLTRCDVWLSNISGEIEINAYWRPDNFQKWTRWDGVNECATMTDPTTTTPHVWKNLLPEQRPLIKSFSIPDIVDGISTYQLATGFGFQIRLQWIGSLRVERIVLSAQQVDETDYAYREGMDSSCKPNDVTGNEIRYEIPISFISFNIVSYCRQRGGTATVCGFSEVTGHASSPPKKYRTLTGSGISFRCNYSDSGCSIISGSDAFSFSGSANYSEVNCALTDNSLERVFVDHGFCPSTTQISTVSVIGNQNVILTGNELNGYNQFLSGYQNIITGKGVCFVPSDPHAGSIATGSVSVILSNEDTDQDAIDRLIASTSWPGFSLCTTPETCCLARYEQRTGFSFNYIESEFNFRASGFRALSEHTIQYDVYRRLYGSGSYVKFSTITDIVVADSSGNISYVGSVPNIQGYESYVANPSILL